MTHTEELVYELCNKTFLSLWSFANPIRSDNKELCDILIVCDPDIIIFSVKDIKIKPSGNRELDIQRWNKRAIDDSVRQLYGAERYLLKNGKVFTTSHQPITIIKPQEWTIHRIAVCFGRGESYPATYGKTEYGGFYHTFDEKEIEIVLKEFDTIHDFIKYLSDKEALIHSGCKLLYAGEEEMIATYILNQFSFRLSDILPDKTTLYNFSNGIYDAMLTDPFYQNYKKRISKSYLWDDLIEDLTKDYSNNTLITPLHRDEFELSIRQMAREGRESRTLLSEAFGVTIGAIGTAKIRARLIHSNVGNNSPAYVILTGKTEDREFRHKELLLRCRQWEIRL